MLASRIQEVDTKLTSIVSRRVSGIAAISRAPSSGVRIREPEMPFSFQIVQNSGLSSHITGLFATTEPLRKRLALLLAVAFFVAFTGPSAIAESLDLPDFKGLVAAVGPAVVKVTVAQQVTSDETVQSLPNFNEEDMPEFFRRFFENMPEFRSMPSPGTPGIGFGSGFIYSEDGLVITNAHVVENAESVLVALPDQREFEATVVGIDERSDIALLKIDATGLPVLRLGDSASLEVGSWVLAIGSPFGFEYSASQGIVSALSRSLPDENYVPFIQTDAAVNPGNSGGPLFNIDGEVIGVNAQIYSRSGGYMGLSFAIPINVVKSIARQLQTSGSVSRGWLGVLIQGVDRKLAESFGLDKPGGALVARVTENSPAASAGILAGDIVLSYDGNEIGHSGELPALVGSTEVGDTVPVELVRNSERLTVQVTIERLNDDDAEIAQSKPDSDKSLGVLVQRLTADQRKKLEIESGVLLADVVAGGPAAAAGMMKDDVLVTFNRQPVNSAADLRKLVAGLSKGEIVPVLLMRSGNPLFIAYALE